MVLKRKKGLEKTVPLAESRGFEPPVPLSGYTAFREPHLKPLGQLSVCTLAPYQYNTIISFLEGQFFIVLPFILYYNKKDYGHDYFHIGDNSCDL